MKVFRVQSGGKQILIYIFIQVGKQIVTNATIKKTRARKHTQIQSLINITLNFDNSIDCVKKT